MIVKKSYKFRLKLTQEQQLQCSQIAGCCRFVWNKSLAIKKEAYEKDKTNLSRFELDNMLISWKSEFEWLKSTPSQALQQVNKDLDQGYKNFFRKNADYPVFKKKGKHDSFRLPQGFKLLPDLNHKTGVVFLPKLKNVQFIKSQKIKGIVKNVTISKTADRWYISFNCDKVEIEKQKNDFKTPIGIDRGISIFAQCSNGQKITAPNPTKKNQKKIAKLQRKLSRKKKFSKNWNKQKKKLSRFHHHIANIRSDFLHKTSTAITKNHSIIVLEDLKVKNMSASAKGNAEKHGKNVKAKSGLNKSILDQGWYTFFVLLSYKAIWNDSEVIKIDPKYTSQKCSNCGHVSKSNRKSQANFLCEICGHNENADLNASKNILAEGLSVSACGEELLSSPVKQELKVRKATSVA